MILAYLTNVIVRWFGGGWFGGGKSMQTSIGIGKKNERENKLNTKQGCRSIVIFVVRSFFVVVQEFQEQNRCEKARKKRPNRIQCLQMCGRKNS